MNCPFDYDEITNQENLKFWLITHENKSSKSLQECVEQITKMPPIILQPKVRQRIQDMMWWRKRIPKAWQMKIVCNQPRRSDGRI